MPETQENPQAETSLCFVSWNTRGIRKTKKYRRKFSDILEILKNLQADVVFLQETHVGPNYKTLESDFKEGNWNAYFTVHSSRRKGVAILIRDTLQFKYICHDEDCSGGYIVLSCCLDGELYTLVNVYKHLEDKIVLSRLECYLKEKTQGVLVVGGDFNTVLDPSVDCASPRKKNSKSINFLEAFTKGLEVRDTWSHIHHGTDTENRFTWKQGAKGSRIDMFFLQVDTMNKVDSIRVETQTISDHYPLVLKIRAQKHENTTELNTCEYIPDRRPGKISGGEILSAIESLSKSEQIHNINEVKDQCCTLKIMFNDTLKTLKVPKKLQNRVNLEYRIFAEILAKRLLSFISNEINMCSCVTSLTVSSSKLDTIFHNINQDYNKRNSKQAKFAPVPDFHILKYILPQNPKSSNLTDLHPDCPLTRAIHSLHRSILLRN